MMTYADLNPEKLPKNSQWLQHLIPRCTYVCCGSEITFKTITQMYSKFSELVQRKTLLFSG